MKNGFFLGHKVEIEEGLVAPSTLDGDPCYYVEFVESGHKAIVPKSSVTFPEPDRGKIIKFPRRSAVAGRPYFFYNYTMTLPAGWACVSAPSKTYSFERLLELYGKEFEILS